MLLVGFIPSYLHTLLMLLLGVDAFAQLGLILVDNRLM